MASSSFRCSYCSEEFLAPSESLLLNHIRIAHSFDPDFSIQCSYNGCSRTFTNFRTYQNHRLQHQNIDFSESEESLDGIYDMTSAVSSDDDSMQMTPADTRMFAAKWIFGETRSLTRAATEGIIEDTGHLVDFVTESLQNQIRTVLQSNGIDEESISGFNEVFKCSVTKPFNGLTSFHQQLQYYRRHFNFIEPKRIVLKKTSTQRLSGRFRKVVVKKEEILYIPLLETLACQLKNTTVFEEVFNSHQQLSGGILYDYCDGRQFNEHQLFSSDPLALQLILYYDELEICNPLGSRRKKHKIGAFYYLLGNISPHLRSKINNIQLLLLAKYSSVAEFGIDRMLEPIIEDIQKLESETGVPFVINGQTYYFRGTVSIVSADNPASSSMGGFKQSASAFRFCRHCMGSAEDIQSNFVESQFTLRSDIQHSDCCDLLEQEDLAPSDIHHYSVVYGINRRALLNSLQFYSVTSGSLIPDIMHDILEGALPLEVKLMLKVFVMDQKIFSLSYIDDSIRKLNVKDFDGDKPSTLEGISLSTCDSNLHQHAMQMWTLARFLPLAIGHLIPEAEEHWENFLLLLDIIDVLFARPIATEACGYLESLISDHHSCFRELYPHASITMKMHSMIHMPRLILEFGPLINHWTTRFEAIHKYFKHYANIMGNFKNICYSLAMRHQLNQCYHSLSTLCLPGEKVEIGPGKTVEVSLPFWDSTSTLSSTTIFRANWVKVSGTKYQTPCVLVIGSKDNEPIFGDISSVLVLGQ